MGPAVRWGGGGEGGDLQLDLQESQVTKKESARGVTVYCLRPCSTQRDIIKI